jgi:hypothetical protein
MPRRRNAAERIHLVNPPEAPFSNQSPKADAVRPAIKMVSADDAAATLSQIGRDWSEDIKRELSIPQKLYSMKTSDATFYSSNERFSIMGVPAALGSQPLKAEKGDYGIALYSSGGSVYFVLEDMNRGIIVRERIYCIHDTPPEGSWTAVREAVRAALDASGSKKGMVAAYDLTLRMLKPSA